MSRNNSNDIQYWIWASLNKKFGSNVKLRRSGVARRYAVNKHDTDVFCNGFHKQDAKTFLKRLLTDAGYNQNVDRHFSDDYVKVWTSGSTAYKCVFYMTDTFNPMHFSFTHHFYKL